MKWLRLVAASLIMFFVVDAYAITYGYEGRGIFMLLAAVMYIGFNLKPVFRRLPSRRMQKLANGQRLLSVFLVTTALSIPYAILFAKQVWPHKNLAVIMAVGVIVLEEAILFWNGIIRVYTNSVQLGIKWRVIGIVCGWIPVVHIIVLGKILHIVSKEINFESAKFELDEARKELQICNTRYPILLVHGVFFRDFRFFDYWGRISDELKKNGAILYYGNQQSAASVSVCGKELAERIKTIVKETGCEKVNIIAHSKGGLDSRSAISEWGCEEYVASLTTINTPHNGCFFADYLLDKISKKICDSVASKYNSTLKLLGDQDPDFMVAVTDLTAKAARKRNELLKDSESVYYQSVGSKLNVAQSGQFPLNMSYHLVKHFDGANDGLVSVDSAKWGENFIFVEAKGKRGISHGDMIDLNRENIDGFDVREFYVNLINDLKERGF